MTPEERRRQFLVRKNIELPSRKERLVKRAAPLLAAVALTGVVGGKAAIEHFKTDDTVVAEYTAQVESGSNLIQTAQDIRDANNLDFNATQIGQAASIDLDGKPVRSGDVLVISVNENGDVVGERVDTVAEQRGNQ